MKQNEQVKQSVRIKAYTTKEVALLYGVSGKTLKKWLIPFKKEIGKRYGHFYNPKQVQIIFEKLGIPDLLYFN